ncbi:MAG TPA: hypothetical protein VHO90_14180, partial [Bacteroidales bacterium]|nr:hypothetical protein [Bacteroidales bacterium]
MKKATLLMFFAMFGLLFYSCVDEGPMGPEGVPGKDGLDAEVYSSGWLHPTAWSLDTKNNEWFFQIQNSNITDYMLDEGLVVVYMSVPGDVYPGAVRQLPAYAL